MGSRTVTLFALNTAEDPACPWPATMTFSTLWHMSLYSAATGPGKSASKNSLSQTRSTDYYALTDFRMRDMLKLEGMNTFLWFEVLAKNELNPRGLSRSRLMNTGLAVWPELTSTLKRLPSGVSPAVLLK